MPQSLARAFTVASSHERHIFILSDISQHFTIETVKVIIDSVWLRAYIDLRRQGILSKQYLHGKCVVLYTGHVHLPYTMSPPPSVRFHQCRDYVLT